MEPSEIFTARADAISQQRSVMRHPLLARLGYKSRLIAAVQPKIGYRLIKIVDVLELAGMHLRARRFRRRAVLDV